MGLLIALAIVVIAVAWFVFTYNRLVGARNRTQESWSQIDVELKRRHDLIPNLVETVRGYAAHESGTLQAVTNARAQAVAAGASGDPMKIAPAEAMLTQTLRSLFAVSENYPDLKAISAFNNLQEQLTATEDKIEFSRRYYNGSARDFNTALQTLPTSLIGGALGFKPFAYFEADAQDREVPRVDFAKAPQVDLGGQSGRQPGAQVPPSATAQPPQRPAPPPVSES
jgi:LemA protein